MIKFAESDKKIAEQLKQRLSQITQLLDLRVFGSRAAGTGHETSDLDIFIQVSHLTPQLKNQILEAAWEVGFENFVVISALIFTRDEIENSPLRASPIVKNILAEGIPI